MMGYFSNGEEGMCFEESYCSKCIHGGECAVWDAHMLYNYRDCNDENSILHLLIERTEEKVGEYTIFGNKCRMFSKKPEAEAR